METLLNFIVAHPTAAISLYCLLGGIGLIGLFAKPLRKRFPRFAGIIELCRGAGPDAKKLMDGLSLILFGKVPSSALEALSLAIKRWTKVGMVLVTALWMVSACASTNEAMKQAESVCPIPDRTVAHVKLAISLAKVACDSAPLTDEQLAVCDKAVESAESVLKAAPDVRAEACKAWPYIETVNTLTANEKLGAAVKLASALLQCGSS
jgi:hypothetical protein